MPLIEPIQLNSIQKRLPQTGTILTWYLNRFCCYDCTYCATQLHDSRKDFRQQKDYESAVQNILETPGSHIHLAFSGGEPTANPHLFWLLDTLSSDQKTFHLSITTNGFRDLNYLLKLAEKVQGLTVSFHPQFGNLESLAHKVVELSKNSTCDLGANLMSIPGSFEIFRKIESILSNSRCAVNWRRVRNGSGRKSLTYSPSEEQLLKSIEFGAANTPTGSLRIEAKTSEGVEVCLEVNPNYITRQNLNHFKGWSCAAGTQYFTIWNDWQVYACEGALISNKPLGSIMDRQFKWPKQDLMICPIDSCVCTGDIEIPKNRL